MTINEMMFGLLKALYSLHGKPVHSDTKLTSLGSIQPCCNYCMKTIHSTFSSLSILRYSFAQLSEENENAQASKWQQRGFKHRLRRLRVQRSNTKQPRSTVPINPVINFNNINCTSSVVSLSILI